ncbi:MAG TPA: hypothetical protein VF268_16265 [Gammaproteobacteria bacterium]
MFSITHAGKRQLEAYIDDLEYNAVPTVVWSINHESGYGGWIIGFIEAEKIPPGMRSFVHEIDNIEFLIDGPGEYMPLLDQAVLDCENGRLKFLLVER